MTDPEIEQRFARFVERHVLQGEQPDPRELCEDRPDLLEPLRALVARYLALTVSLSGEAGAPDAGRTDEPLPEFDGFRTIERLGVGGMGEVFKLQDQRLDRIVAAKVLRTDRGTSDSLTVFLREARAMALFQDRRIVQIFEFRPDADPPVILMEFVDGFELGTIGPSLEHPQRARIVKELCEAVDHAHRLGVQHRDLKPTNVMLDARLSPRILDFGLCAGEADRGHFQGTPAYLAPEQLDPARPIDARSDVYGLGAILYELLCGAPPCTGRDTAEILDAVRTGRIRLPVEIEPGTPEPLQAIALKALEQDPANRYPSARDMALDLGRYLDGRPVLARPSQYSTALGARVKPHLLHIEEWLRLKLLYPHEAAKLRAVYGQLDAREDDWIVASRSLSYSQIALYLGAFLLMCGSLLYFGATRVYHAVEGVARPFAVLGLPFIGLNVAAHHLARRDHKAVSVAFHLGGVTLLPLFLLILFHETGLWVVGEHTAGQLFQDGSVSNHQLQATILIACAWSGWLALRTRTLALSTVFAVLLFLLALALLADAGLRSWIDDGRWDRLALHLLPLVPAYWALGAGLERAARQWFARPLYTGAAIVLVAALELLALDGRLFGYLGLSLRGVQAPTVADPLLLDTLAAMSLNGVGFYATGSLVDRYGSDAMRTAAWLLLSLSPFAVLEPLAYLNETGEYARAFDWLYLLGALAIALASHRRQRRSFYYAGLLNTGVALWLLTDHYQWFDRPLWAAAIIAAGLAILVAGFGLAARERRTARPGS